MLIMLNCQRVNKSRTVDITEFLIQQLNAAFAMKSLLELRGDECDSLNSINFKTESFKIRKNMCILGSFKIRKNRLLSLWPVCLHSTPFDVLLVLLQK